MRLPRLKVAGLALLHVAASGLVALAFVLRFGQLPWPAVSHPLLIAGWDALMLVVLAALVAAAPGRWAWVACATVPAVTIAVQGHLYALNLVTQTLWSQNVTGPLVWAYAPTFFSGRQLLPVGSGVAVLLSLAILLAVAVGARMWTPVIVDGLRGFRARWIAAALVPAATLFVATIGWGVSSDWLFWRHEMITSFVKPGSVLFEPTPRRRAVADRDEVIRADYPRVSSAGRSPNVVLIVVDSLRADRMGVYGYSRPTTPFLTSLVERGRMRKVDLAFSTCAETYCGITSLLTSREFRDISARSFTLTEALRAQGYTMRFLLSGSHRAWYGLDQFYGPGVTFEGSQSRRYTIDDDRVVLEGLEQVPSSDGAPTFFQIHLMSTHYLGVRLPAFRRFGPVDVDPSSVRDPQTILNLLNDPNRYDDKVTQVDDYIRRLYVELDRKGYLEDAIVIVTADHGEGLGERHWGHGRFLYTEDIRVPLLIDDDLAVHYARLDVAAQIDIAPTILDRLGLPVPGTWTGRSILEPAPRRYSFHQTSMKPTRHAVVYRSDAGVYAYLTSSSWSDEELYDVTHDPAERHDLSAARPDLLAQLRGALRDHLVEDP
jgi:hypothetical protein